jgi:ParB/RepB/Spo0J family partition protein
MPDTAQPIGVLMRIPTHLIRPFRKNPRKEKSFTTTDLLELAESIKSEGQKEAITVKKLEGVQPDGCEYELVNGERRLRACTLGEIQFIDAIVKKVGSEGDQHLDSLMQNFMAKPHTHMEISDALAYQYNEVGRSVAELATALGRSTGWVYEYLSFQKLAPELAELMDPSVPKKEQLSRSLAKKIVALPDDLQLEAYHIAMKEGSRAAKLQMASSFIENNADGPRRGRKRKPADDVKLFLAFVRRLGSDAKYLLLMRDPVFRSLVQNRSEAEVRDILGSLKECREQFDQLSHRVESALAEHAIR